MTANKRVIPPDLDPVTEQSLLNYAVSGGIILASDGIDLTACALAEADRINKAYDDFLNNYRRATAMPESDRAQTARRTVSRVKR